MVCNAFVLALYFYIVKRITTLQVPKLSLMLVEVLITGTVALPAVIITKSIDLLC